MRGAGDFFSLLAFLEMLREGGGGAAPVAPMPIPSVPPMPPPPVPVSPVVPAHVVIPPPGVIDPGSQPGPVPPPVVPPVPVAPPTPPGTLPPTPSWTGPITPCPSNLAPFPGGWVPDVPVSTAVQARAEYWNPILWDYAQKTIAHPTVCEQFGGRWLMFVAAWHAGDQGPQTFMATEAWRLASEVPLPVPVVPAVVPPPMPAVVPPSPIVVQTPLQHAAVAMASALNAHGYKQADQPIYRAFQKAAGTSQDGFPGTGTMGLLRNALASIAPPVPMPNVPIYPWHSKPGTSGYDGVNAPTWLQWTGQALPTPGPAPAPTPIAPVAPLGPPGPVNPYPGPGAWQSNSQYIARYQNALTWLSSANPSFNPQGVDGKYGPHTAAAVKAFQAAHGLTQDGEAGQATANALDAALGYAAAA